MRVRTVQTYFSLNHLFFTMHPGRGDTFFLAVPNGMQKFLGQGLNPCHSSDNAESLAARPLGNSGRWYFRFFSLGRMSSEEDSAGNLSQMAATKRKEKEKT